MVSKSNGDNKEQCRLRRQRRIQLRRLMKQAKKISSSSSSSGRGNRPGARLVEMTNPLLVSPVVGSMSIKGRRRTMEDKVVIRQKLCSPEINRRRHVDFYAIYDGHGGHHVSALCSQRMHVVVEEELMRVRNNTYMSGSSSSSSSSGGNGSQQEWEAAWKRMLRMCFLRMDRMSSYTCDCGSLGYPCGCPPAYTLRLTGSTAVVAILTQESIIVANCGDSRAVLSRAGRAVPLSCDHKPDKLSERARIEAYGGKVIFAGVPRVGGVLAVSRALGDNCLKPYVIPEPEISFIEREAEDECLILASDGMWDVISNEMACQVARQCLREENPVQDHSSRPLVEGDDGGAIFSSRSASAAAVLTNLALTRLSRDNISVIVVDLKRNHAGR